MIKGNMSELFSSSEHTTILKISGLETSHRLSLSQVPNTRIVDDCMCRVRTNAVEHGVGTVAI
eukprot:7433049-Alexandrium_andersonii.AAC.1